jgi:hypothetical protein
MEVQGQKEETVAKKRKVGWNKVTKEWGGRSATLDRMEGEQ